MEHPGLAEIVRAIETLGGHFQGEAVYVPCKVCKRTRRFALDKVGSLRLIGFMFCLDCMKQMQLATTQQNQIIV